MVTAIYGLPAASAGGCRMDISSIPFLKDFFALFRSFRRPENRGGPEDIPAPCKKLRFPMQFSAGGLSSYGKIKCHDRKTDSRVRGSLLIARGVCLCGASAGTWGSEVRMEEEKKDWRTRLYEIVSTARPGDTASFLYDCFMILVVIISLIPLSFKTATPLFVAIDHTAAAVFSVDYLLRLLVADKRENGKPIDFLLFPARPMSIIDILSIIPSFTPLTGTYRLLRLARVLRLLRITRVLKMFRYSKNLQHLMNVFRRERVALGSVCVFVVAYILVIALVIINVEPETFDTYFDAVYWAATSLTTIGYGDLYPVSDAGRIVTIISSLVGILVVALPTGIITAGIMIELEISKSERRFAEASISRRKQMGLYDPEEEAVREMIKKADALKKWENDLRSREEALEKEENRRERKEESRTHERPKSRGDRKQSE